MIINKKQFTEFKFSLIVLSLLLTHCIIQNKKNTSNYDYFKEANEEIKTEKTAIKYAQKVFDKNFKSLTFSTSSLILGEPCYNLHSKSPITIQFDILNPNTESLQYQLIHCTKSWTKSNINSMDAIDGFDTDYIENQQISYGPIQQYVHYSFNLPNENTEFLISGNYIIKIFREGELKYPLAHIKFFVSEQISNVNFIVDESSNVEQSKYLQSYQVECSYNSNSFIDPFANIFINIQQNHQLFNQQWLSGPHFIKENKLIFLQNENQTFNGGNEFRFFDVSSYRNGGQFIEKIFFEDSCYRINLKNEQKRSYKQYLQYKDMNGKFFIRTYDHDDAEYQSEYGWVHFHLNMRKLTRDSIFIFGQLSNWELDTNFLMKYDSLKNQYHQKLLLKQGFYNYLYVTKNLETISVRKIEGAHFETNNEYVIKVYYNDPLELFDRILSYTVLKSS